MTAVLDFLRKYICCCLGSGQENTVLSHNRVNCSSCFGHIHKDEEQQEEEQKPEEKIEGGRLETIYEGRVLRPNPSRILWWQIPFT